ncbi:cation:proton antiporter [Pleionea sediminis]|uniref:cation:proton antiporter n=1 Tax=Pleionea sediminis TaxID=2569479 RepID=UPI0011857D7B|nr:cation:proton antiporter [Pleionea sediminis]
MESSSETLLTFGGLLLLAIIVEGIGRRTALPRVTLLILFGFVIGRSGIDILPDNLYGWFNIIADVALLMVGYLLGGNFTSDFLKQFGKPVLWVSIIITLLSFLLVSTGLFVLGIALVPALVLGAIAAATDPAAVADVIHSITGKPSRFSRILQGIVAIDDAWGLIVFSVVLAFLNVATGNGGVGDALFHGLKEIFGAVILGFALGLPMAYLSGRIKEGEPLVIEALGFVLLCGGLARYFEFSHLLSAMIMGAVVVNFASHHTRPVHAIENVERPFLSLFFLVAGASLHVTSIDTIGYLAGLYVLFRILARYIGGFLGSKLAQLSRKEQQWMGLALLPQAGVAMGMALVATERFEQVGQSVLTVIIATTVLFELTGPVLTRMAVEKTAKAKQSDEFFS